MTVETLERATPPMEIRVNPVRDRAAWEQMRQEAAANPGKFHGDIAKSESHWYDPKLNAWIRYNQDEGQWMARSHETGKRVEISYPESHEPWAKAFDDSEAPFYRWFAGGLTNACFNEVDRHVLMGYGDDTAFWFEGDRWDSSKNGGRGGPVVSYAVTRKKLLLETVKAARVLQNLGLKKGDRLALNMPNIMEQIYYTEAAKRLGIIYTPVFGGFSDKTLSDRIHNAGAKVVITSDGGYRNAQIVAYKEVYTDKALDNFVPVETVHEIVAARLQEVGVDEKLGDAIRNAVKDALKSEITVERADVMRAVGQVLAGDDYRQMDTADKARLRTAIALGLVDAPERVEAVIVVKHTRQPDVLMRPRDKWSHELLEVATAEVLDNARAAGYAVNNEADLLALGDEEFVHALWQTSRCEPVDAEYPLFFIYTSGSTGKPKGVVHTHGGYVSGLSYSVKVAFDALPGDVIFVVADPGWITGQSYMLCATMTARLRGVIIEGSPVFPSAGRYASIIERYKVNVFKAGVTFLKAIMTDPQNVHDVKNYDMSTLRVATFCAEPCSPAVQQFGMGLMTPQYINSYWATEHGGIVWTHFYGNSDFPLRADAHTYPLPWVMGDVWLPEGEAEAGKQTAYRPADLEEKGEIVITAPYPYLARTIWGDAENFGTSNWKGDFKRYVETYWGKWANTWAYTQGDFAMKYADGSFSLHGRSDDVINVSGHRMGTEEIEGAILRDKTVNPDSPVGNCIVVGAPHREKGLTPVAFVLTVPGRRLTVEDHRRLTELVKNEKGSTAIPSDFIEVSAFPETRSGKYMRRFLKNIINDEDLGDTTTLRNPESLTEIRKKIEDWKRKQAREEEQQIFETYRYFRIQYNTVKPGARVATVMVTNPPVNALNERALDELITIVDHLARRDDVKVVIFTGQGTKSFVAGADIKQLLEEMNSYEDAIALPNNAHLAFRKIETMNKPCIAAINGVALGGGLEFALACHVRIAEPTAMFGQPEINLNLLPGYGGTQRLPRLINERFAEIGLDDEEPLEWALQIILGGRNFKSDNRRSEEMLDEGIVDWTVKESEDILSYANDLAVNYINNRDKSDLHHHYEERQRQIQEWEKPRTFPDVLSQPTIQTIIRQAEAAGRTKAVERAIEAVRYGWENGFSKGLQHEAELFAQAVIDPEGGKKGIQAFLDKKSPALPVKDKLAYTPDEENGMLESGSLLAVDAPFYPGFTPIPTHQYAMGAIKDVATGEPIHGDPIEVEKKIIIPVEKPGPNQALLYMLTSEINFNDIWALTGIPVSQFDGRERDWHITGSGGTALVAAVGSELKREGRVKVGDLVVVYSGESELLSPSQGNDPMFAEFHIQGYDGTDGSHQQFLLVQGPQIHVKPADLTLEAAGSYILNLGTTFRALYTILKIEAGKTLYVEGAATGTGMETVKAAARNGLKVTGLVSTPERAEYVKSLGAVAALNRKEYGDIWTRIPRERSKWAEWEAAGQKLLDDYRASSDGKLADYGVSHAGETAFPRTFQLLEQGGTLTYYGASNGYHFTFLGKHGSSTPYEMMQKARLRAGEAVLIYYGTPGALDETGIVDNVGLEAIEAARQMGGRCVVVTYTDAQREFVQSLGYGDLVKGVVSIQTIKRREGADFLWPMTDGGMPELPDPKTETEAFKEAVRQFNDLIFKPIGAAVGGYLRTLDNPRGYPDFIFERAGHDALSVSSALVKPYTGRIVYSEEMGGQRYSFYAPQIWMRQRRLYMPTANIFGTHLCNAYEVTLMNDQIDAGLLEVTDPMVVPFDEMPEAHQAIWENRHAAGNYVSNHALPMLGLKTLTELYEAWAAKERGDI
jgi:acrylyl-CoA reductase (NADPH) / 3-hydroxypropionyl-CoA dehydratase / 3-hydroxypropionyl-CoA synthetase